MIRYLRRQLGFNPARWLRDSLRVRRQVLEWQRKPSAAASIDVAVILMPWLATSVPWFSLVFGLFLARSASRVSFVIDDLPFGRRQARSRFVLACVGLVLRVATTGRRTLRLSEYRPPGQPTAEDRLWIGRLAQLNTIWALRGEINQAGRREYASALEPQLSALSMAVASCLRQGSWSLILIPGGIYGSAGVWAEHARRLGIRVASFDSGGKGVVTLAADGIASQLQDIPRALAMLKQRPGFDAESGFILEAAQAEMQRRRQGVDRFASQLPGTGEVDGRFDDAVLIALNSSWDSAALGLHAVFDGGTQWIVETARWLLEQTDASVIVRQHPAERFEQGRSSDDYQTLLAQTFGNNPRLHFIAAADPVNSYELLSRVRFVIVYTSTLGVEAAALGKVVLTASHSYYSKLGFVWRSDNLPDYREQLQQAVAGRYQVNASMRNDALTCYYLTQCCNWVSSPFSPENFPEWSRQPLSDLYRHDAVQALLSSVQHNVPVALLMHEAKLQRGLVSA